MVTLYLAGVTILVARGNLAEAQSSMYYGIIMTILALLAVRFVKETERPAEGRQPSATSARATLCVAVVLVTGYAVLASFIEFGPHEFLSPSLRPLYEGVSSNGALRFILGACVPFVIMRLVRVPNPAMGLGRPRKDTWKLGIIWISTAIGFLAMDISANRTSVLQALKETYLNFFRNGFTEEYLFRGVLLGRLRRTMRTQWAVLIQALAFAAFHYPLDIRVMHGDIASAIAVMICVQGLFGYALGILTVRTRSILIGSIFHAAADATDII